MILEFYSKEAGYLKQWYNWTGEIPQKGDIVVLHYGDNNEFHDEYEVLFRKISGTEPDKIIVDVKRI